MCSMHGLPTIGTIGFGWFEVSGRSRVPSPPAMTTAFIRVTSRSALATYGAAASTANARPIQKTPQRPVGVGASRAGSDA